MRLQLRKLAAFAGGGVSLNPAPNCSNENYDGKFCSCRPGQAKLFHASAHVLVHVSRPGRMGAHPIHFTALPDPPALALAFREGTAAPLQTPTCAPLSNHVGELCWRGLGLHTARGTSGRHPVARQPAARRSAAPTAAGGLVAAAAVAAAARARRLLGL